MTGGAARAGRRTGAHHFRRPGLQHWQEPLSAGAHPAVCILCRLSVLQVAHPCRACTAAAAALQRQLHCKAGTESQLPDLCLLHILAVPCPASQICSQLTATPFHMPQDRIDSLAERAIKWASLTRKKNADKKLAVTVFSFPPDKGNVGTAAYLNVFGSIYRVLKVTSNPSTTLSLDSQTMT